MAGISGGGRAPIGLTTMRGTTLADMNRGRVRGWALIGSGVLVVLAVLSWPDLAWVLVSAGLAAGLALFTLWIHLSLPDAETEGDSDAEMTEPADLTTGERD